MEKGINHDLACAYSPDQNGKAERMNRTLTEMVRCMLIGAGLPKSFWEYGYKYAAWVKNRFITTKRKTITPWELMTGEKPSLALARVFGCMAQVWIPKEERGKASKFNSRARWGICLGPALDAPGWTFKLQGGKRHGKLVTSRDVRWHETLSYRTWKAVNKFTLDEQEEEGDLIPTKGLLSLPSIPEDSELTLEEGELVMSPHLAQDNDGLTTTEEALEEAEEAKASAQKRKRKKERKADYVGVKRRSQRLLRQAILRRRARPATACQARSQESREPGQTETESPMGHMGDTRADEASKPGREHNAGWMAAEWAREGKQEAGTHEDEGEVELLWWAPTAKAASAPIHWRRKVGEPNVHHSTLDTDSMNPTPAIPPPGWKEPLTWKEALECVYKPRWILAARSEEEQIRVRGVYEWAVAPPGTMIMGIKWVFKRKTTIDGGLDKFKGRSCVQGFKSVHGVHHFETYSPAASSVSARLLLAIGCSQGWIIDQMDVTGAFLYADLDEVIYCYPPPGFEDPAGKIWKLKKALYGLKQAPRQWMNKFKEVLLKAGFVQSIVEPALFMLRKGGTVLYLLAFVDDFLLISPNLAIVDHVKGTLCSNFDMTDLGAAKKYLGWHVRRDLDLGKLWISLGPGVTKALADLGIDQTRSRPTRTPLPHDWQAWLPHERDDARPLLQPASDSGDKYSELLDEAKHVKYRQGVGYINYAAGAVRPDLSYASSQLSQVLHKPRERHYKAMLHTLRYLASSADLAICYDAKASKELTVYTDSDYAGCKGTRKSVSGAIFMYAGGPVAWISKKQDNVTLSATEAEYGAMTLGTRHALWIREMLAEVGLPQSKPTPLYVHNLGAVQLSRNPITSTHSRHVAVSMNFVREKNGAEVTVQHVSAEHQKADYLTKALGGPAHAEAVRMAGQESMPQDESSQGTTAQGTLEGTFRGCQEAGSR